MSEPDDRVQEYLEHRGRITLRVIPYEVTEPLEEELCDSLLFLVSGHLQFYVPMPGERRVRQSFDEYLRDYGKSHWVFPVEAYIHGGVVLAFSQQGNFPDRRWDVSQVGAIFAAKKEWRLRKSAHKAAGAMLDAFNAVLSGDAWAFIVEEHSNEDSDSPVCDILDECYWYSRENAQKEGRKAFRRAVWKAARRRKESKS